MSLVAIALTVPALIASSDSAAEDFDCSQLEEVSFDDAGPKARACDVDVEVTMERTPWETTWATPDGNSRLVVSAMATRTDVSGEWTELDTTIEGTPGEGTLEVAAPVYPIELNAGGTAGEGEPLGSIERDGKRLDVWFPAQLPVPVLDGSRVFYDLTDGVRLIVSVNADGTGFLPVVELADRAAADRFQALISASRPVDAPGVAGDLVFRTAMSDGLRLVPEHEGTVLVVDADDEVHFMSTPPVMWDSAGGDLELSDTVTEVSRGDRTSAPLAGDALTLMETAVEGTSIVISPDADMLSGSETVWPVYIDPSFNAHTAAEWVAVRTGGFTGTLYKWTTSGGEGTGYCTDVASCNTVFRQRLSWEFNGMNAVRDLGRANVISASFRANGIHSASCTATATDLVLTNSVSTSTTWSSIGDWSQFMSSKTETFRSGCGTPGYRNWDATEALRRFAENDWPTVTMGLKAQDESTMTSWKRFGHDATLSVVFNQVPDRPSSLKVTNPSQPICSTGAGRQMINSMTPKLSAIVSDPDGDSVSPHFQVYTKSGTTETEVWNSTTLTGKPSGTRVEATVASGKLVENKVYLWRVTSKDDYEWWSGWSVSCEFMVDIQKPNAPKVTPVPSGDDVGVAAVYEENVERGGKGLKGKFTVSPNGSTDVVAFKFSFGDPTAMAPTTVAAGSSLVIEHIPAAVGPMTLHVESIDRAGNVGPRTDYKFDVASPKEDAIWKLDEGSGTAAANSGPVNAGPLTIKEAGWVNGPHELFGSRDGDKALKFDGVDDEALARGPVVDTTKPFAVSAHVWLDSAEVTAGSWGAVLAQDGLVHSGFRLRYNPNACVQTAGTSTKGCWEFLMMATDQLGVTTSAPVRSTVEVRPGEWVHLIGEHDPAEKKVRLWVCNAGTPENPGSGEPVKSEASIPTTFTGWRALGAFTIGRAKHNGNAADRFKGYIDNVRVFSGEVVDEAKIRRLCQGAEAEDLGGGIPGLNALDPTVSEQ